MANTRYNFDIDPYYDDFETSGGAKEQNYMRVLFRPGYAVQARELTQIQSILQNQIKSFGDHVFQDGSPVQGGHLTLDVSAKSVKLLSQYQNVDIDLDNFSGMMVIDTQVPTTNVNAQVVATDNSQIYPTIIVKYLSANEFSATNVIRAANTGYYATVSAATPTANASVMSINEGVFYVDGYFVYVAPQTIVLDPYGNTPSYKVGLQIVDSVVDETSDSSLLDPAQESFNYQAPGATRYKFSLELTKRALTSTDDSKFFELVRVENGIITKQVRYPIYSELEKTLARRTYDESGDYTVKPFRLTVSENQANANTFKVNIEPGKAYVKGYEFETYGMISMVNQKANTTNTSTDYNFSVDYGNYLIVTNLRGSNSGFASLGSYEQFDAHTVPTASINTKSAAAYSNTKIGTLRIRNVDYAGTDEFYVYVLDMNTSPVTINVAAAMSNTLSANLGLTFSSLDDAYKGVNLRMVAGAGTDAYTRTIASYNGATKIAVVDSTIPFAQALGTSSQISLAYNVKDIDSIAKAPTTFTRNVYAKQESANGFLPAMDIANSGKTSDGKAILYDSERNKLIYELPQSYISPAAFSDVEYFIKKNFTEDFTFDSVANACTSIGLSGTESWFFGNGSLSGLTARSNFILIVKDKKTSGFANGDIIDIGTTPNLISQSSSTGLDIRIKATGSFSADIIATAKVTGAGAVGKTLKGNTSNTTLTVTDVPTSGFAVLGTTSGVMINKTKDAQVWFKDANYIANTPGVQQSLYVTDVINIIKVYESGNIAHAPNTVNAVDITSKYILDSGQRDNYYDFATVTLRDGVSPPRGQTVFMLQCFDHSGETFFNAASYNSIYQSNQIPNYATNKGMVSLRDVVDFRPVRANSNTSNPSTFALETKHVLSPEFSFEAPYDYYVPRIDRVVLTTDKEFKIIKGISSVSPIPPKNSDDSMVLYNMYIPAYTANVADIGIQYVENKRYTMRDIGAIEKRVENLEYYTSLNILELQAKNQAILYEDNISEKEKYGIIADDFTDFSVVDSSSADLLCNLSKAKLAPYKNQIPLKLKLMGSTVGIKQNERTISLAFTEESCIVQNTVTKAITVQPYEFAQFQGIMSLYPETDYWYSTKLIPEVLSSTQTQSIPGPTVTPAPEINPTANIVSAPATTGVPFWRNDFGLGSDGFGAINIRTNWFGSPGSGFGRIPVSTSSDTTIGGAFRPLDTMNVPDFGSDRF